MDFEKKNKNLIKSVPLSRNMSNFVYQSYKQIA